MAEKLATLTAAVAAVAFSVTPSVETWWIAGPLWVVVAMLGMRWLAAAKRENAPDSQPNVQFERAISAVSLGDENDPSAERFFPAEVLFANRPKLPAEQSTARRVAAWVAYRRNGQPLFPRLQGAWATPNYPGNVGFNFQTMLDVVDIEPNGIPVVLLLGTKFPVDEAGYGFSRSQVKTGLRHSGRKIPVGESEVDVELAGQGVSQIYTFKVINPGSGGALIIEGPTKVVDNTD